MNRKTFVSSLAGSVLALVGIGASAQVVHNRRRRYWLYGYSANMWPYRWRGGEQDFRGSFDTPKEAVAFAGTQIQDLTEIMIFDSVREELIG